MKICVDLRVKNIKYFMLRTTSIIADYPSTYFRKYRRVGNGHNTVNIVHKTMV